MAYRVKISYILSKNHEKLATLKFLSLMTDNQIITDILLKFMENLWSFSYIIPTGFSN